MIEAQLRVEKRFPWEPSVRTIRLPQTWDELTRKQFKRVSRVLSSNMEVFEGGLALLYWFSGISRYFFNHLVQNTVPRADDDPQLRTILDERATMLTQAVESLSFCFDVPRLAHSKLPRVGLLRGMSGFFSHINTDQFGFASKYFSLYQETKEEKYLHLLIGTLYRPYLLPYRNQCIEAWAWCARWMLRKKTKVALMLNYVGLMNQLPEYFQHTFAQSGGEEGSSGNWYELVISVAGSKMGDDDKVRRKNILLVLTFLEKSARDHIKQQQSQRDGI